MPNIDHAAIARSSGLNIKTIIMIGAAMTLLTLALMALSFGNGADSPAVAEMRLPLPLVIHLATVIPALPLGAYVLLRRKGDALHKLLGRLWVLLMLTTAIASLWVGGSFSFIHLFSIATLGTIPLAIWRVRRGDLFGHRRALEGLYIGLLVAGAFTFIPGRLFGTLVFG